MNPGSELVKIRWKKEKPDPEYFKRISKLAALARTKKAAEKRKLKKDKD